MNSNKCYKRILASSLRAIKSCLDRTSDKICVLTSQPSKNTKKFWIKRPNQHQQHSAGINHPFEGALQHCHIEEVVEGMHHKYSLLEQCQKHRGSMVRVIKPPYLNAHQLLDVDRSKVHPLVRNLFHVKVTQVSLTGRLKLMQKIGKN